MSHPNDLNIISELIRIPRHQQYLLLAHDPSNFQRVKASILQMIAGGISPQQLVHLGLSSDVVLVCSSLAITNVQTVNPHQFQEERVIERHFESYLEEIPVQKRSVSSDELVDKRLKRNDTSLLFEKNIIDEIVKDDDRIDESLNVESDKRNHSSVSVQKKVVIPETEAFKRVKSNLFDSGSDVGVQSSNIVTNDIQVTNTSSGSTSPVKANGIRVNHNFKSMEEPVYNAKDAKLVAQISVADEMINSISTLIKSKEGSIVTFQTQIHELNRKKHEIERNVEKLRSSMQHSRDNVEKARKNKELKDFKDAAELKSKHDKLEQENKELIQANQLAASRLSLKMQQRKMELKTKVLIEKRKELERKEKELSVMKERRSLSPPPPILPTSPHLKYRSPELKELELKDNRHVNVSREIQDLLESTVTVIRMGFSQSDEPVSYFDAFIPKQKHHHRQTQKAEYIMTTKDTEHQHAIMYLGIQKLDAGESIEPVGRYFQSLKSVADFEESVKFSPEQPQLWINYASHFYSVNTKSTLQILARGLEKNRTSVDLWMFYCELYLKTESEESVRRVFSQATGFVKDVELWWRWFTWEQNSQSKLEILEKMFLMVVEEGNAQDIHDVVLQLAILWSELYLHEEVVKRFRGLLVTGQLENKNDTTFHVPDEPLMVKLVGMDLFISIYLHYIHLRVHHSMCLEVFGIPPYSFVVDKTFVIKVNRIDTLIMTTSLEGMIQLMTYCDPASTMTHVLQLNINAFNGESSESTQESQDTTYELYSRFVSAEQDSKIELLFNFISQFYELQVTTVYNTNLFTRTMFDNFMGTERDSSLDIKIKDPSSRLKYRTNVYVWKLYISLLHLIDTPQELIRSMFESAIKAMVGLVDQRIMWKEWITYESITSKDPKMLIHVLNQAITAISENVEVDYKKNNKLKLVKMKDLYLADSIILKGLENLNNEMFGKLVDALANGYPLLMSSIKIVRMLNYKRVYGTAQKVILGICKRENKKHYWDILREIENKGSPYGLAQNTLTIPSFD